jgi:hypothetical protein
MKIFLAFICRSGRGREREQGERRGSYWCEFKALVANGFKLKHGVGAGLFNLFTSFKAVGEPAPTDSTRMVQDLS